MNNGPEPKREPEPEPEPESQPVRPGTGRHVHRMTLRWAADGIVRATVLGPPRAYLPFGMERYLHG
ncbi:MAG: hypothetical protein ACE5JP_05915 [Candidatus Bipolaricaulia bacterium]